MGQFSFRSSGTTLDSQTKQALATTALPIGIATPLSLGGTGLLRMTTSLADQLNDNLRNLVQTNWGERLGSYFLGANLRPLMSELVSMDDFDTQAITRIKNAVARWMPWIDLDSFESVADRTQNGSLAAVLLTITYNIPSLNVRGKKLQVTLYAM